jgi:type II secretory pathway pseudopilin PulG
MPTKRQTGFALFEILLVTAVLGIITYGVMTLVKRYQIKHQVATVERQVSGISIAMTPFMDISSFNPDDKKPCGPDGGYDNNFLDSINIPVVERVPQDKKYSAIKTNLISGSQLGCGLCKDEKKHEVFFTPAFTATCRQLNQIISDYNNIYGIFVNNELKAQTSLRDCQPSDVYTVHLVSPKTDDFPLCP